MLTPKLDQRGGQESCTPRSSSSATVAQRSSSYRRYLTNGGSGNLASPDRQVWNIWSIRKPLSTPGLRRNFSTKHHRSENLTAAWDRWTFLHSTVSLLAGRLLITLPFQANSFLQLVHKLGRINLAPLRQLDASLAALNGGMFFCAGALQRLEQIDNGCRICQQRCPLLQGFLWDWCS